MTLYKTMDGTAGAYGHGEWSLPRGKRPGKWMPKVEPALCESGYHFCRDLSEVLAHIGPELYEVEVRGEVVDGPDKAAAEEARLIRRVPEWNETTARLWAADCARLAVNRYAAPDQCAQLHATLDMVVGFAEGRVERSVVAAARDAARAAAWDAARDAARAAARDAARAAARAAAWAAARAAAWDAARAAAWDAARAAAWDAARAEQLELLRRYLDGEVGPLVEEASVPHPDAAHLVFLHDALLRIEAMKETADELKRRADILQSEMASLLAYLKWEANP